MKPLIFLLFLITLLPLSFATDDGECDISDDVALEKVKHLGSLLDSEDRQREAIQSEENELIQKAISPLVDIVKKDHHANEALNELLHGRTRAFEGTSVGNCSIPKREFGLSSRAVINSPFPLVWTAAGGDARSSAQHNGDISIFADETGWASGGVGIRYRPPTTGFVTLIPSTSYTWRWHTKDCLFCSKSRTNGFFGLFVQIYDLRGNHIRNLDFRQPLWNKGGADIGGIKFAPPLTLSLSSQNQHVIWIWFSAAASGHDATGEINADIYGLSIV